MECDRCGSTEFEEVAGFYTCFHCQTQSQGFAKEVADEDDFSAKREVNIKQTESAKKRFKKKKKERDEHSKWTTIEAYNLVYLAMIDDFFAILKEHKCVVSEELFLEVSMQIWFNYLSKCEIAFRSDEHLHTAIKLHPASRHRDNFVLGSADISTAAKHVPLYNHSSSHSIKEEPDLQPYGPNYTVRPKHRASLNELYYYKDEQSIKYLDPRQYSIDGLDGELSSHPTYLRGVLQSNDNIKKETDEFCDYIKAVVDGKVQPPIIKAEMEDQCETTITETEFNSTIKKEDDLLDNQNYDEVLLQRMPSTSKNLHKVVPLSRLKKHKTASSPLLNDLITKPKLLAFLFITIRLLNANVYLSDLIRWCIQGNIRYIDALQCLPESWEIMWIDVASFKDHRPPAYHTLVALTRHMVTHCSIVLDQFPDPDIEPLVRRYICDLNLPKDLFDVVTKRYGHFLNRKNKKNELVYWLPDFEVIAMIAILLTLRDLFDLLGTTEEFVTFSDYQEGDLFIWSSWLNYSKTRLNAIQSCILNLPVDFKNNLHNIDELLTVSKNFFTPFKEKNSIRKSKMRSSEHRAELQQSFLKLFDIKDPTSEPIRSKLCEKMPASLYPLSTYTDLVKPLITNSFIEPILRCNFKKKLITPYIRPDGSTFHTAVTLSEHSMFTQKNQFTFFASHTSEAFNHLMDLASIITCADMRRYFSLFSEAEGGKSAAKSKRTSKQRESFMDLDC